MAGTDVVTYESGAFAVLHYEPKDLQEIIRENVGADSLTEFDLDRVKVPSGGGLSWTVPSLDGETEMKELDGVIVHWANRRAYWEGEYTGGNEPPQCSSPDGEWGFGDPGDSLRASDKGCEDCPFSAFGSGKDGIGQACKAMRQLFFLTPDSLIPIVVTLPPASLANARKYFLRLVRAGARPTDVVTKLTLTKDKSASGITYSKVELTRAGPLAPEDAVKVKAYADSLKPAFERARVVRDDVDGEAA